MSERTKYKTKQLSELYVFLEETQGKHFTAADVRAFFQKNGSSIGTATVYRRLEALIDEGRVRKYYIDENISACYEYLGQSGDHNLHYHLKCEKCGKLFHLDCGEITHLEEHISNEHNFQIDPARTVFYGVCEDCEKAGLPRK